MVNQSVIDSSVDLEQLKDIEDLIPDMDKAISEKVETFLDKSGDQIINVGRITRQSFQVFFVTRTCADTDGIAHSICAGLQRGAFV